MTKCELAHEIAVTVHANNRVTLKSKYLSISRCFVATALMQKHDMGVYDFEDCDPDDYFWIMLGALRFLRFELEGDTRPKPVF